MASEHQKTESKTIYARVDEYYMNLGTCCTPITLMNKRGVFEVTIHRDDLDFSNFPFHNEVVAVTFDPKTRVIERITNAFEPDKRVMMDSSSPHYGTQEIVVRGYWRNPQAKTS